MTWNREDRPARAGAEALRYGSCIWSFTPRTPAALLGPSSRRLQAACTDNPQPTADATDRAVTVATGAARDVDLTITPFLSRDGQPITFQEGSGWAIVAQTDNFDAACAFVTDMVATDTWVAAAQARKAEREADDLPFTGTYTGNAEADDQIFGQMVDLSSTPVFEQGVNAVLDAQENAFALPTSPANEEFRQAVLSAIDAALTGTPVDEALATADQEAQDAIDSAAP